MINRNVKKILILCVSVLSFSINAQNPVDKDFLVKQCYELSENVISLTFSQGKKACVDKLGLASAQIENAGDLIINDEQFAAKQELDNAVYTLQYAELSNCNRYIEISHSKFEAQKIKSYLGTIDNIIS
jgi:hypothetical protein